MAARGQKAPSAAVGDSAARPLSGRTETVKRGSDLTLAVRSNLDYDTARVSVALSHFELTSVRPPPREVACTLAEADAR